MTAIATLRGEKFCYLTTTGRVTGQPREIEIWFDVVERTVYLLSGGRDRSNWVRNLKLDARVGLRIGTDHFEGAARVINAQSDEDALARRLLVEKYRTRLRSLAQWGRNSLPIAIDVDV